MQKYEAFVNLVCLRENQGVWVQAGSSCCEEQQHQHTHKQPLIFLNFRPLGWLLQRATAQTHTHTNNDLYILLNSRPGASCCELLSNTAALRFSIDSHKSVLQRFYKVNLEGNWLLRFFFFSVRAKLRRWRSYKCCCPKGRHSLNSPHCQSDYVHSPKSSFWLCKLTKSQIDYVNSLKSSFWLCKLTKPNWLCTLTKGLILTRWT